MSDESILHPQPAFVPAMRRFSRRSLIASAAAMPLASRFRPVLAEDAGTPEPGSEGATPVAGGNTQIFGDLTLVVNPRPDEAGPATSGGDLTLPISWYQPADFSPTAFFQNFQILASVLDPLVWIDDVTMEPKPWLAEKWEWNEERTEITYTLREGVKWHDGGDFTADDVVFSLTAYRDDLDSGVANFFWAMAGAEAIDERQVRVTLSSADPNWLFNASSQLIFQRKQFRKHWGAREEGQRSLTGFDWTANRLNGTGPWIIDSVDEEGVSLKRNEDYFDAPPHCDTLNLRLVADAEAQLAGWRDEALDLIWPVEVPSVLGFDRAGTLYAVDSTRVMFAAFNFDNPSRKIPDLLASTELRQALNLGIDREKYAADVFRRLIHHKAAGTIVQPWAHDKDIENPARDVKAAKKLLADAGFADSDKDGIVEDSGGDPVNLTCVVDEGEAPELLALLDGLADDLAEIGIGFSVSKLESSLFRQAILTTHAFDLAAFHYAVYPGFTDFDLYGSQWDIRINPQGWNPGGYSNEAADEAIRTYFKGGSEKQQVAALKDLQKAVNDDLFGLWFGFPQDLLLAQPGLRGFRSNVSWPTLNTRSLWRE